MHGEVSVRDVVHGEVLLEMLCMVRCCWRCCAW